MLSFAKVVYFATGTACCLSSRECGRRWGEAPANEGGTGKRHAAGVWKLIVADFRWLGTSCRNGAVLLVCCLAVTWFLWDASVACFFYMLLV